MSPRVVRDVAAIEVLIDPHGAGVPAIGSGRADQGGGPLRGGLTLMNRFKAVINDPEVPYEISMTVGAHDGWLAVETVTVSGTTDGPAVSGAAMRSLALSLYMQRIREELGKGSLLLARLAGRTERTVSFDFPLFLAAEDRERLDFAQMRRAVHATKITTQMAAEAYLAALASPDPGQNRRPTAAAAEKLGASRGHISRLLTQARREGLPGLGPSRPPRGNKGRPAVER